MNFASWIILGIVVTVLALAVKATFFKGKRRSDCCDTGNGHDNDLDLNGYMCSSSCKSCPSCGGCAFTRKSNSS